MKERIKEIMRNHGLTNATFGDRIGFSKFAIDKALAPNGGNNPSKRMINAILKAFPNVSAEWLMNGSGEPYKAVKTENRIIDVSPYFDASTIEGGAATGYGDEYFKVGRETGWLNAPGLKVGEGIPYVQVHGDSMVNRKNPDRSIPSGSWVGLSKVSSGTIQWGEVYAFMTVDGPIIKKLQPSDKEGCIKCVSFNVEDGYMPFDLPTGDIVGAMYKIEGVLCVKRW